MVTLRNIICTSILLTEVLSQTGNQTEPEITASVDVDNNGIRATEDAAITVTCTAWGVEPTFTVVWYNSSITGQELARRKAEDGNYTVTLPYTFTPTREDDRQQLVCRSYYPDKPEQSQESQNKTITLYLFLKPLEAIFLQPTSVVTGSNVTARCTTYGCRPAAEISWMYRGQIYTPPVIIIEDQSSQTFSIESVLQRTVTAADNGQTLQCIVAQKALTSPLREEKTLNVQFPVERSTSTLIGNTQIEANGITILALECTTGSSNPASDIAWGNGSGIISNNNGYTETPGANNGVVRSQILTLRPTRDADGDNITCSASNGVLQVTDTTSTVLDLRYSPEIADMSDMDVTEGEPVTLKCNASSKPVASFTWKKGSDTLAQGTGTTSYNGYDYTMPAVNRTQAGTYTCTADNQLSRTDSKQTRLTVLYPPEIDVLAVNTTVNSQSTTVTCDPSGVPDQYTYQRWLHTWNGQTVTHPVPLPTATKVLTLTDLSYAHSGEYTCEASNGVKRISKGSGTLLVKSFPVIVGVAAKTKEIKTSGQLKQTITASFQYYSNAGSGSVKVYRTSGTSQEVGDVSFRSVTVILPVFLSEMTVQGTECIISISVADVSQFGTYEVRVTNEIDTVNLALVVQPLGPPEPPFDMIIVLVHQSVDVTWKSGFPNGLNQTFVIQLSTDNSTWRDISHDGGLSYQQTHETRVSGLSGGQLYYIRMLSVNNEGESPSTRIITFTTEAVPESDEDGSSTGAVIGGAVGGTLAAVVLVAGVLFLIWWRKGAPLPGKRGQPGNSGQLYQVPHSQTGEAESAGNVTDASSDGTRHYEALKATDDKRLYAQLQTNQTSANPHTYENYGLSPYENLRGNQNGETETYSQVRPQGSQRAVYENL